MFVASKLNPVSLSFCALPKVCGGDLPYVSPESLEEKHHFFFREALHTFASTKKMGGQEFCDRYQAKLKKELEEMWQSYLKHNEVGVVCFTPLSLSKANFRGAPHHLLFLFVFKSPKTSSAPSGPLPCSLSSCASSMCSLACFSLSACPPSPCFVTVLWVPSWWPCWRGLSSASRVATEMWEESSTRLQGLSWSRWEQMGRRFLYLWRLSVLNCFNAPVEATRGSTWLKKAVYTTHLNRVNFHFSANLED